MKIEIRCSECNNAWLVDEFSRGGELLCPNCLTRIALPGGTGPAPTPPPARPVAAAVPRAPEAPPPAPAKPAAAPQARKPKAGDEIVCPRCKLHFLPWGRESHRQKEHRHTVLIVDDMGYFRRTAQEALFPRFLVKTAENTTAARAILACGGIDLIVLDLTLEGGRLFLSELNPKPCPILIYTAQDESELYGDSWEELSALGADDLVLKGMNLNETLARKVGNLLGLPVDEEHTIG